MIHVSEMEVDLKVELQNMQEKKNIELLIPCIKWCLITYQKFVNSSENSKMLKVESNQTQRFF